MRADKKQRRHNYAALKRRLFLRTIIIAICSIAAVFACRAVTLGRFGNFIVHTFSEAFRIDDNAALHIYQFGIRNYLEPLSAVVIIIFVVIGFRLLLNSFETYLDEITDGIDRLAGGRDAEIKFSPELGFVEHRLTKVQQVLERKDHEIRRSEQRKNDLVIYSAHDIRTPLTSALGYLILLDGNPDLSPEERKKYIGIALAKTRELDGMISELFEITRYNLHDITLEKSRIDLYSMFLQMKEEHYPELRSGKKRMLIDMDEDLSITGDAEKLARAFHNLLKNAVAYSDPDSSVEITAYPSGEMTMILFKNKCKPIPQKELDHLFDRFYRLDAARTANLNGAGLGLAIAKEIITLHGGTIIAEGREDGIDFIVSLPAAESA